MVLAAPLLHAQDSVEVSHSLDFSQKHNQYLQVTSVFPVRNGVVELSLPSWQPGSYLIRDFSRHVEDMSAADSLGNPLPLRKTAKNRWRIETGSAEEVSVSYQVWAGELNVSKSWIESAIALLNGASVFLYHEGSLDSPQRVIVDLPADWSRIDTSLKSTGRPGEFLARDYHELVDSPIMAGNTLAYDFEVEGQPYALILSGENSLWKDEKSRDDIAKLVKTQQDFWGVNPFDRKYLFMNFFMGPFGGLEHDHSTVMMGGPWHMRSSDDYIKWLGLVSHEFFHSWNVRRMRPAVLTEYDYDREMYTRELWLAEGLSSYYDDLLLFRSGLIGVNDYFIQLAREIRNYETQPGRHVRSAELASFDTWIKQYKPDENSVNSTVSYYRKGAVVGFVTDMAIRRATDGAKSLDDVMRDMYSLYGPGGGGYPSGAFEKRVEAIAGAEVRKMVEEMLRSTDDPPVDEALEWYGLSLNREHERQAAESAKKPVPAGFGINVKVSGSLLIIDQVVLGYSGAEAGLLPGDELLAIGGYRVTPDNYAARLQRLRPGEEVELTVVRHDLLMNLPARVQHEIPQTYLIVPLEKISRRQKARMESWIGRELRFLN
jgi:predicted metalloprotease with PDZ domain